jgi:nicotinamidase-related amidase
VNALICLNIALGILNSTSTYYCRCSNIILEKIAQESAKYDYTYFINDNHQENDKEFEYLPPHFLIKTPDIIRLPSIENKIQSQYFQILTKNTPSFLTNPHNRTLILNNSFDNVTLAGFTATIDIVASALDLLAYKQNAKVDVRLIGDFTDELKTKSINYLHYLNLTK